MADWTPKLTLGLWGLVQSHVRGGGNLAGFRDAARSAGETPDAATLSHLYSRAVGGEFVRAAEADYRSRVDRNIYLGRRPGGGLIADLPVGFSMTGRYRQVVKVLGTNPITGLPSEQFINVQFDRLLSRGEAIDLAMGAVISGAARYAMTAEDAEYEQTWRRP